MTDEKIKQEVLEEWKDDLKNRGLINIDDGELIYNMSDIEEAIDLTIKKTAKQIFNDIEDDYNEHCKKLGFKDNGKWANWYLKVKSKWLKC